MNFGPLGKFSIIPKPVENLAANMDDIQTVLNF